MKTISIGKKTIGQGQCCFLIAEIGQAHDGSLGIAHSYIDAIAESGVDAIKFQTHIAEAESTLQDQFRTNFSYEDANRYDYWKRMEFTEQQWIGLKEHCDRVGLIFLSSPFSVEAVELLDRVGVPAWKVGSGEINNSLILEAMLKTSKPILLSTGMSSWRELDKSITILLEKKADYAIFQCTSKYPTSLKEIGLNVLRDMRNKYNVPIGLSDHSGTTSVPFSAIANNADILEFHIVFNKKMFGPDARSSLNLEQLNQVVKFRNDNFKIESHPVDKDGMAKELTSMKALFNKSLVLSKSLEKGSTLKKEDLTAKKPGTGIPVQEIDLCIGRRIINDQVVGHILSWDDLEG
jgi:N,N'-diacetyllegionaminate synthase